MFTFLIITLMSEATDLQRFRYYYSHIRAVELVQKKIDSIFLHYEKEEFADNELLDYLLQTDKFRLLLGVEPRPLRTTSGWLIPLASGKLVSRSYLQDRATPVIKMGPLAVPHLLNRVKSGNNSLRYIAIYSLSVITGEEPFLPTKGRPTDLQIEEQAIQVWLTWYKQWAKIHFGKGQQ